MSFFKYVQKDGSYVKAGTFHTTRLQCQPVGEVSLKSEEAIYM